MTEEELKAEGFTVIGGVASKNVECDTRTYKFTRLPATLDEIKAIPRTDQFGPVAAAICAIATYDKDANPMTNTNYADHPIFEMMDFLNGPNIEINNVAKSGIYDALRTTLSYGRYAYFEGASPGNAYTPATPYTFTLVESPYYIPEKASTVAHPNGEPERRMILISFTGDDAQRYVDTYYSGKDNCWYTWDNSWQHLVASMKAVDTSGGW